MMKLDKLTIALRQPYMDAGPDNPYEATLSVSYDKNKMQVQLCDDTCRRILALAGDEIAHAAQIQISDFVRTALAVSDHQLLEGAEQ